MRRKFTQRSKIADRRPLYVRAFALLLAFALAGSAGACSRAQLEQQQAVTGPEFILEIFNPQPRAMNVMFTLGGATTTLGRVAAKETRRWAIPNQGGDEIRLVANDSTSRQTITKTLDLDKGKVVRWEIRE